MEGYKEISEYEEYNEKEITDLLIGHKVKVIGNDTLELDNGIILKIEPNEGCGGCNSGWYSITNLNNVDNAITNVEFVCDNDTDDPNWDEISYKIFVYCEDTRIKLLQVDGNDGNGWYGSGYEVKVYKILEKENNSQ